ncbi:Glutaredoxin [Purpureocillium takamizusanense]|uniref:Glutaredoxin n=1 Tax=Purpureocillium takamizusanense TaxID=2060973 RepID=A0A9Q8QD21_9HYPO|nr:Glutaredoxin [Purpureocillium takamizusanense]UNI17783.1 Glutaredoxin [Purpureocillium takamizusanense]
MFPVFRHFFSTTQSRQATMATASDKAQKLINDNAVIVFSKSYCPHCRATKQTLSSLDAEFTTLELDNESDGGDLQDALEQITGQRTVPNVFIGHKHIGGNSDVQALVKSGELKRKLLDSGALKA